MARFRSSGQYGLGLHPRNPQVGTGGFVAPGAPTTPVSAATIVDPVTTGGIGGNISFTTSSQPTLQALRERYQRLQEAAPQLPTMAGMQSPWQGAAYLANTLVNSLQQRAAAAQEERGQQELTQALTTGLDPNTGQLSPQALSTVMARDPEMGMQFIADAIRSRREAARQEHWEPIPTPQGETGQWFRSSISGETKKVGGSSEQAGPKIGDILATQDNVNALPSYKNMAQAAPIWNSLKDAATRDTPQADLNIIIGMAKLFDPTSVVRTQEGEAVQQTAGLPTEVFSAWKYLTGQPGSRLDAYQPGMRRSLLKEGFSRMQGYNTEWQRDKQRLEKFATAHGMNPAEIVPDFGEITDLAPSDPNRPDTTTPPPAAGTTPVNPTTGKPYVPLPSGRNVTVKANGDFDFGGMNLQEIQQWETLNGIGGQQ